eukprot:2388655-Rhodomonas_salina.1
MSATPATNEASRQSEKSTRGAETGERVGRSGAGVKGSRSLPVHWLLELLRIAIAITIALSRTARQRLDPPRVSRPATASS